MAAQWLDIALSGTAAELQGLLKKTPAALNQGDENGQTLLTKAAGAGNVEVVDALIKAKADLNAKDRFGRTAVSWAAAEGEAAVASLLVSAKAAIDADTQRLLGLGGGLEAQGRFLAAARNGNLELVRSLAASTPALLKATDGYGQSALSKAAAVGNFDICQALLGARADLNLADKHGRTPVRWALREGKADVVKLLVDARASIGAQVGAAVGGAALPNVERFDGSQFRCDRIRVLLNQIGKAVDQRLTTAAFAPAQVLQLNLRAAIKSYAVNGDEVYVKLQLSADRYLHIRASNPAGKAPRFLDLQDNKSENDPLAAF